MEQIKSICRYKKYISTDFGVSVYMQYWEDYIRKLGIFDTIIYQEEDTKVYIIAQSENIPSMNIKFGYDKSKTDIEWKFFYEDRNTINTTGMLYKEESSNESEKKVQIYKN